MSKNGTLRVHRGARIAATIILLCLVGMPLLGQSNDIQYFYDDIGRLIKAVDQNGSVATYSYDAVGNLLSIARSTLPANNGLAILNFTPQSGPVGQSVTIQGQGFSTTVSSNTVQFNGVAAAVTAATASSLTVTVPFAATTGLISVTVSGQSASSTTPFTVTAGVLQSVAVSPSNSSIHLGSQTQLTATGTYINGSQQNLTTSAQWGSSNPLIATVSNSPGSQGLVTPVSAGTVTITASNGQLIGLATVQTIVPSIITVTPSSAMTFSGNSQQFTATATFTDGTTGNVTSQASWSSTNTFVATVSSTGVVTSMAAGTTTICAVFFNSACSSVSVVTQPTTLSITPTNVTIPLGMQQFNAIGTNGQIITSEVNWSSSNTAVATISTTPDTQGLATGLSVGTTTITAIAGTLTASTLLTITAAVPTVTISPGRDIIQQGNSFQFKATLDNTNGGTQDVTQTASWESSAAGVATVNSQGQVTGVAPGSATITATSGSASGSASVIVTNPSATVPRYVYESAYSSNSVGTVSVYSVNASTGQLRSLGFVSQAGDSSALALDPASQYLYIANSESNEVPNTLSVYTVGANGSLTPLATPPVPTGNFPNTVAADPFGRFVYVVNGSDATVSGFAVGANGGLTPIPGAPFSVVDFGAVAAIVDPSGRFVYVLCSSDATISAFTLDPNSGALTPITGSPFAAGSNPATFAVDPAGKFLLVGNPGQSSNSSDALPPADLPGLDADRSILLAKLESWPLGDFRSSNAAAPAMVDQSSILRPVDWSFTGDSMPLLLPGVGGMTSVGDAESKQKSITQPNCGTDSDVRPGMSHPASCGGSNNPSSISVFSIGASTGALTQVTNSPFTISAQPNSIVVDPTDRFVYVTYASNVVDGFSFDAGSGNLTELPDAPYVTSASQLSNVSVDPSGEFVYAAGGGYSAGSNLLAFSLNSATGTLTAVGTAPGPSGDHELAISSGASGVTFTPQFAYVLSAGGPNGANNITGYSINPGSGALTPLTGSPFAEGYSPVAATVDPWNPLLYVTNNCSDTSCTAAAGSISAYTIDPVAGTLAPALGSPYAIGSSPFGIAVDPSGSYVFAVDNQDVSIWGNSINLPIGSLSPLIGSPTYGIENGAVAVGFDQVGSHVYTVASADYYVNKCTQNCASGHLYVYNYPLFSPTTAGQTASVANVEIVGPSPSSLALDTASWFALVPDSTTNVVYVVSTTSATQVPGSPFGN